VLEPLMRGSGLRGLFGSQIGVRHRPDHLDVVPRADDIQHFRCAVPGRFRRGELLKKPAWRLAKRD
jgi:hypothetical protein